VTDELQLLLLHGFGATGDVWREWKPVLDERWPGPLGGAGPARPWAVAVPVVVQLRHTRCSALSAVSRLASLVAPDDPCVDASLVHGEMNSSPASVRRPPYCTAWATMPTSRTPGR
jgi:hypothetical protein